MKNVPKRIYLQIGDLTDKNDRNIDFNELSDVCWSSEKIFKTDIEFIRKPDTTRKSIECIAKEANAETEPNLASLWHDVSEEPRLNQWFIAQIGDNAFDTFVMTMDRNQDWKTWSKGLNIKRWAYIDDLLPKGCEK